MRTECKLCESVQAGLMSSTIFDDRDSAVPAVAVRHDLAELSAEPYKLLAAASTVDQGEA